MFNLLYPWVYCLSQMFKKHAEANLPPYTIAIRLLVNVLLFSTKKSVDSDRCRSQKIADNG